MANSFLLNKTTSMCLHSVFEPQQCPFSRFNQMIFSFKVILNHFKELVLPNISILSSFIQPYVIQNLYDFLPDVEHFPK